MFANNTNSTSRKAQLSCSKLQGEMVTLLQRLTTELKINSVKDDVVSLHVTMQQVASIKGFKQAIRTSGEGALMNQVVESTSGQCVNKAQRISGITVKSSTGIVKNWTGLRRDGDHPIQKILQMVHMTQINGLCLFDLGTSQLRMDGCQDGASNNAIWD